MDILYVVMPAYNEEGNIKDVVAAWYPTLEGKAKESRLIVADSGSTDGTHSILSEMRKDYPQLEILGDTDRQHGPKLMALYDYAIKKKADYIFQTDSDGQTDPEEFRAFWEKRMEYDGIFGNRIVRGDGKSRAFVEKVVCLLLRLFFGVRIPDANAPFRLMKTETVKKYLYKLPSDYNIPNIMLTTYFVFYKESAKFFPISFMPRKNGVTSINLLKIFKIGWKALTDFSCFRRELRNNDTKEIN